MNARMASIITAAALAAAGCGQPPSVTADRQVAGKIREQLESGQGAATAAVAAADPTGWATIKGVFRLEGNAPDRAPLNLTGDDAVTCAAGGVKHLDEALIAGPGGAVKNALLLISSNIPKDREGWIHPELSNPAARLEGPAGFDQKNCIFLSHVFAMQASQTLQILNSDPLGHNTNIAGGEGSGGQAAVAFNQLLPAGSTVEYTPGGACNLPMTVICNIHPWMKAYLMVVDHPYFAVTGDDGGFELANVPAGVPLELRAWHESKVSFSDGNGEWKRGRSTVTLEPGQTLELNLTVKLN